MTALTNYNTGSQVSPDQLDTFEQTCDTFADLRSFVGTTGIQVFARGQSVPNDGLGGAFWWNDGSTAPDDNLNVIVPSGALAGAWNRIVVPATSTSALPIGPAGGDLGGNYPDPVVETIGGDAVGTAAFEDTGTSGATIPLLNGSNTWSGQQSNTPTVLSPASTTFTPDGSANNYSVTLVHGSPNTLANPSATPVPGTAGQIVVIQSSSGSDTIGSYGGFYKFPGGTAPTLSTTAGAIDILSYYVVDATNIAVSAAVGFQ